MPWPQHWHQARPMGQEVRNYPASPYPRPSARVVTEGSRVRVSGSGLGFAARLCHALVRTALAGTGAYTLTTPNRGARVVVFLRPEHPKLVTWVVRRRVLDVAMWRSASDVCRYSPPVGTRVASAQVARGRRHGREAGLGTWVCERRVCESEAATNGVRETVVARRRS